MKLLRFGPKGAEKPGLLDADGVIRDLSGVAADFSGAGAGLAALEKIRAIDPGSLPEIGGEPRLGACLADIPNFHCIGLNYAKHAQEAGMDKPSEPILFSKATSCLSGPYDPVVLPKDCAKGDWEAELGVVIGRDCEHVSEAEALDVVSGYCIVNDVSERAFQFDRAGQWIKGKSAPSFGPAGPWLVTPDEIPDPQNLAIWLDLNEETAQLSNTADMIFSVAEIISHLSRFMRLRVGDLIATGTPEGVGMGMEPQRWLRPGDVMTLGVAGLGEQRLEVRAWADKE